MQRRALVRDPWIVAGVACALGFVAVAAVVNGQGTVFLDAPVIAFVRALPVPEAAWRAITQAGGWLLVPVGVALVLGLVAVGRARMALIVAIALVAAAVFTDVAKLWVARPRPPDPAIDVGGYSFPSGHTLNATVAYGIAAVLAWRSTLPWAARVAAVAGLIALAGLVGLSRIALGVHYPSDVVAGWLAGTVFVAVVAVVDRADRGRVRRDRDPKPDVVEPSPPR